MPNSLRRTCLASTLFLAGAAGVSAVEAQTSEVDHVNPVSHVRSVTSLRGRYRPLLVFSPMPSKEFCQQAQELVAHRAELHDRDVAIYYEIAHDGWSNPSCAFPATDINTFSEPRLPDRNGDDHLFRKYKVDPNDFTVILIGKDGGEKLRSHKPVSFEQLRDTIDAMPMRQREAKQHAPS